MAKTRKVRGTRKLNLPKGQELKKVVKKQIKNIFHPELKYIGLGNAYGNSTGSEQVTFIDLTGASQNTGDAGERIGDKITLEGVSIRYAFNGNANGFLRIMVIQWYPDTSVDTPSVSKVFHSLITNDRYICNTVYDNVGSVFSVLYDRTHAIDTAQDLNTIVRKNIKMKYAKKTLQYKAATTQGNNHIYAVIAQPNDTNVLLYSRAFFYDM